MNEYLGIYVRSNQKDQPASTFGLRGNWVRTRTVNLQRGNWYVEWQCRSI